MKQRYIYFNNQLNKLTVSDQLILSPSLELVDVLTMPARFSNHIDDMVTKFNTEIEARELAEKERVKSENKAVEHLIKTLAKIGLIPNEGEIAVKIIRL